MRALITVICFVFIIPSMASGGSIEVSGDSYNFGSIPLDFTVHHDYYLKNVSSKPVTIDSLFVNCDCSQLFRMDSVIAPGDSGRVRLSFTTTNYFGPNNKMFMAYTSDPEVPEIVLYYQAEVGQWSHLLKPRPLSAFFLPPHKMKKIEIGNVSYNHIVVELADQVDTLFEVAITKEKARRKERAEIVVTPRPSLRAGTYISNFRLKVTPAEGEPAYLTIPVKIVRY